MVLMRIPDRSRLPSLNLLDRRHCHLKGLRVNLVCKRYAVKEDLDLRVTHIRALPANWGDQVRQVAVCLSETVLIPESGEGWTNASLDRGSFRLRLISPCLSRGVMVLLAR